MCSGNRGHGGADLEPKLDLILWLGSLRLTCQGLLGFSAASFKGMLLVALCVHVDPASVPGWQGRKRSGQPEAEVPKLWELPAGFPIGHHPTSSIFAGFVYQKPACCLLRRRRRQRGASMGASLAPGSSVFYP